MQLIQYDQQPTGAVSPAGQSFRSRVDRPVFIVGAPRSGTTVVFETLSAHEDLAWFSNFLNKYPEFHALSVLSRLTASNRFMGLKNQTGNASRLRFPWPYASECYPVWERCCGRKFRFEFLIGQSATDEEKQRTLDVVSKVMRYHGRSRFACKITGPARIGYLNSLFPDAMFIHLVRDGRAVVRSLMNVEFWKRGGGLVKPWWSGGLTEDDTAVYKRHSQSSLVLAAVQWRRIIHVAREEASHLSGNRYFEVRYEDISRKPDELMDKLMDFSSLPRSRKVHNYIQTRAGFKDMNYKFHDEFSATDLAVLQDVIGEVNASLGYI